MNRISNTRGLIVLLCLTLAGLFLSSFIALLLTMKGTGTPALRAATVVQDVLAFVLPAALTALLCSRLPATFLRVERLPRLWQVLWGVVALLVSIPLMDSIIAWNEGWVLPSAWGEWMRQMEAQNAEMVTLLMGGDSVADLVMSLLIVAVLAAVSEELLFRGALLRLLSKRNVHMAVWVSAAVFSAFHMQVLGFVPRMLLGALFGYAAVWSGSLWLPVLLHALNNGIVVVATWRGAAVTAGTAGWMIAVSGVLTVGALCALYRVRSAEESG